MPFCRPTLVVAITAALSYGSAAQAGPAELEPVQVTATRVEESVERVPAAITLISAEELRQCGARTLSQALSLVAGVEVSPGGDGGPAGSVPAFMGLREFDAFLLVVDGIPYGGAFNPQLTTLDMNNVERIEVMRGAAPVTFGATSFVGVIHVIHYAAGQAPQQIAGGFGSHGSAHARGAINLGARSTLSFNAEQRGLADDRAGYDSLLTQLRSAAEIAGGEATLDVALSRIAQDPTSPQVRQGARLTSLTPLDANHNPEGAEIDERRVQINASYARQTSMGELLATGALARTRADLRRGFLSGLGNNPAVPNAAGYDQAREITDGYLNLQLSDAFERGGHWAIGADYLAGKGEQESANYRYFAPLSGASRAQVDSIAIDEFTELEDERQFFGLYAQADWAVTERFDVLAGLRANFTQEDREGEEEIGGVDTPASDSRNESRLTGHVGASWRAYARGGDSVTLYADYRNSFKPAAIDFGPEAEAQILEPEEAKAWELGLKQRWLDGRLDLDLSAYRLDFKNLVVPQNVNGRPGLTNAGELNLDGYEAELHWHLPAHLGLYAAWAHHSAEFGDYLRLFDGVPTQLRGNTQELTPRDLRALALLIGEGQALHASLQYAYVGERFLNKRNTARAGDYETFDASIGYDHGPWSLQLTGANLGDKRPPISESELGDAQYYRLPGRHVEAEFAYRF